MALARHFVRFCLIGGLAFFIDAGGLLLLMHLGTGPYLGRAVSQFSAATFTWWLNRHFTFESSQPPSRAEWARYVLAMGLGALLNYGIYSGLVYAVDFFGQWPVLAVVVATGFSLVLNFIMARRILYRPA